jgi:hypothetical protein
MKLRCFSSVESECDKERNKTKQNKSTTFKYVS